MVTTCCCSSPRWASVLGEPIMNSPAGTTTISGQPLSQSLMISGLDAARAGCLAVLANAPAQTTTTTTASAAPNPTLSIRPDPQLAALAASYASAASNHSAS